AKREFAEELGQNAPDSLYYPLQPVKLKSGKIVFAFASESDLDTSHITSNHCEIEWPPRSGKKLSIPEIDKAEWFTVEIAKEKINKGLLPLIEQLLVFLDTIRS